MWAALFGLIAVCSTIVFSAGSSGSRRRRALVGDAEREPDRGGAIEEHVDVAVRRRVGRLMPAIGPSAATISAAMTRGALRRRRASSKATGQARSPIARVGGASSTIDGIAAGSSA